MFQESALLYTGPVPLRTFSFFTNASLPLLVALSGGFGVPMMTYMESAFQMLSVHYNIVTYDYRGISTRPVAGTTLESHTQDALTVATYFSTKLQVEKVAILGMSAPGAHLAMRAVQQRPSLFWACVVIGPSWNYSANSARTYEFLRARLPWPLLIGGPVTVNHTFVYAFYMMQLITVYGAGCARCYESYPCLPWPDVPNPLSMFASTHYSLSAIRIPFDVGRFYDSIIPELFVYELESMKFDVPMYMFQSELDRMCHPDISMKYWARVVAPRKRVFWYENSGHFIGFERPARLVSDLKAIADDAFFPATLQE